MWSRRAGTVRDERGARAIVKAAEREHGIQIVGFLDGFAGLLADESRPLGFDDVSGILVQGGRFSGRPTRTTRSGSRWEGGTAPTTPTAGRRAGNIVATSHRRPDRDRRRWQPAHRRRLGRKGVAVVGVPKTIDNDVAGTDVTLGFDSALTIATEAVDRLHSTAASHHRLIVLEVMGRNAGWIALEAGIAGGGDVILIPEIPFGYEAVATGVRDRVKRGRRFSIVVVAEGARCPSGQTVVRQLVKDSPEPVRLGGVGAVVAHALEALLPYEVRYVVLGHVQRGGPPTPFDRILAARFGVAAIGTLAEGQAGCMVALRGGRIERVPLAETIGRTRCVDAEGERVRVARSVGTIFGDR